MILLFPTFETLRLVLGGGQLPQDVAGSTVNAVFSATQVSAEPVNAVLAKTLLTNFKKLGIEPVKGHLPGKVQSYLCWHQLLTITKLTTLPELTSNTPILFETTVAEFPQLVNEMLRLGNDRQSFRSLSAADDPSGRMLLKVLGPPYYTLLRAIDRFGDSTLVAYTESTPGIWVQYGYSHPLGKQLKPPVGQQLLLQPTRHWQAIDDTPFSDIYDAIEVHLPEAPIEWAESRLKDKLTVPLRLVPGNAADMPEFWVLSTDGVNQLDNLVRDADDRLMQRLAFAIASNADGPPTILLKTRPSKLPPPVLALDNAIGFKPYWKLTNLFVPVGQRLMPTLRREAIRRLLAEDPANLVWLMPTTGAEFTPESLPDTAFRPLEDWVDYVIDHDHEVLEAWVRATEFDFESFQCNDDGTPPPKEPPAKKPRTKKEERANATKPATAEGTAPPEPTAYVSTLELIPDLPTTPNELRIHREQVERDFIAIEGSLDAPERVDLWMELASINSKLSDLSEASICWLNALWYKKDQHDRMIWTWLRQEDPDARRIPTAQEFDAVLQAPTPSSQQVRSLALRVMHAARQTPLPEAFRERLSAIRTFIEAHEGMLPVRHTWLTWLALTGPSTGSSDVLALARVRDRILQRLFNEGLNRERDFAYFLRTGGERSGVRTRELRERAMHLFRIIEKWHHHQDLLLNRPFVELMFAFGFAKLGEVTTARELMTLAQNQIAGEKEETASARAAICKGLVWRVEQAIGGHDHKGPLPPSWFAHVNQLDANRKNTASHKYVIDRMMKEYWIFNPEPANSPYASWYGKSMVMEREINDLANINDPVKLEETIRKVLKNASTPEQRLSVHTAALLHAVRVSEVFTLELVRKVPQLLSDSQKGEQTATLPEAQSKLLERALQATGHFQQTDLLQALFNLCLDFLKQQKSATALYDAINRLAGEGIRRLRKLGLRDEIDRFLKQISDSLLGGKSIEVVKRTAAGSWADLLCALLSLAEGWHFFGAMDQARPILDIAKATIYNNPKETKEKRGLGPRHLSQVTQAYIAAASQGDIHDALARVEDLFKNLEKLPNTFTTAAYYSRLHLDIVEEIVRSLIHDNLADNSTTRRWLDEDEYLVRRKIHTDFQERVGNQLN